MTVCLQVLAFHDRQGNGLFLCLSYRAVSIHHEGTTPDTVDQIARTSFIQRIDTLSAVAHNVSKLQLTLVTTLAYGNGGQAKRDPKKRTGSHVRFLGLRASGKAMCLLAVSSLRKLISLLLGAARVALESWARREQCPGCSCCSCHSRRSPSPLM